MLKIFSIGTLTTSKINIEANFMGLILTSFLRQDRFKFIKTKRINITLFEPESKEEKNKSEVKGLNSAVATIYFYTPLEEYYSLSKEGKKNWQLETAFKCLKELFKFKSWDIRLLNDIQDEIKLDIHEIVLNLFEQVFYNTLKEKKVILKLKPDLHKTTFFVYCYYLNDELISIVDFFEGLPHYFYWSKLFEECKWENEIEFKVYCKSMKFSFLIDTEKKTSVIVTDSAQISILDVNEYLKDFSIENPKWKAAIDS